MITKEGKLVYIHCDKCKLTNVASEETYNHAFMQNGWILNSSGIKYKNLCRDCQSSSQRKAHDFVMSKFY